MSGGDLSRCCGDDENFSILNVNWKCLDYAGYRGSQADLRKKDDEGKLREARFSNIQAVHTRDIKWALLFHKP